jgi:hypothetical protein
MTVVAEEVPITELEKIEADRVDGVGSPANGIPFLMLKGLAAKGAKDCPSCGKDYDADSKQRTCEGCGAKLPAADDAGKSAEQPEAAKAVLAAIAKAVDADGTIDEGPDVDLGQQIMKLLGQAIINEAQEIKAGMYGETCDVDLLNCAASMVTRWIGRESAGDTSDDADMGMLMASAAIKAAESAKTQNDLPDSAFAYIEDGGSKDADGKTTPRSKRHFPVHDKAHAENALARLSSSPFGGKAKAKAHAAAKKFGIDTDTSKSAAGEVAPEGTDVDTEPQGNGSLSKAVEDAVRKALGPSQERITALETELAKVKAIPVPGGPALSRNVQVKNQRGEPNEDWAAKAALYRAKADVATSPGDREGYRQLAREADEKSQAAIA